MVVVFACLNYYASGVEAFFILPVYPPLHLWRGAVVRAFISLSTYGEVQW